MFGRTWKVLPSLRRGDWRSKLVVTAQIAVGSVALLSILGMVTKDPLLLLGFTAAQGLLLVGVVLFVVVAIFSQRTMVLEVFGPGEVIFREGDLGRRVYVIRAGVCTRATTSESWRYSATVPNCDDPDRNGGAALQDESQLPRSLFQPTGLRDSVGEIMKSRLKEFQARSQVK